MSSQPNISNMPFDQKSPGHREVGVLNCHRPTEGHRDSMTDWRGGGGGGRGGWCSHILRCFCVAQGSPKKYVVLTPNNNISLFFQLIWPSGSHFFHTSHLSKISDIYSYNLSNLFLCIHINPRNNNSGQIKLDGVAPLITDPSTTSPTTLSHKKIKWHVTHDIGHMTCDTWHMICYMWHMEG